MTLQKGGFPLVLLLFLDPPNPEVLGKLLPPSRPSDSAWGAGSLGVSLPPFGGACGAASMAFLGLPLMLLVGSLGRIPGSQAGKETPAHFLYQEKSECRFLNGTQRVRYLQRYFYDRQEFARFDSDLGQFVAVTELGEADADSWNRDEQILQFQKAGVDSFCRHNYETLQGGPVVGRREFPDLFL